ncbi:MAG: sulfatase-like hydrolase/transferase [Lentisphaeraceae bacterium]|nr:sulfatase-like hydrolase/transferase [Lentisphaeraceae bacterium]
MKLLLSLLLFLTASVSAQEKPNILWIVAEDISPFFGCYDNKDAYTPFLDTLAKKSLLYKRAYSTAPICSPSRSCLASGMFATSLGSQHLRSEVKIPDTIKPLAKVFKENGYWTALRNKTDYNFSSKGLFDYWNSSKEPWKKCPKGKPFFAFMNLGSTHEGSGNIAERANIPLSTLSIELRRKPGKVTLPPYYPDSPEMRRIWARYHDLISVFDSEVKSVLENLKESGFADNTIVFIMADHGMGLPRYKRWLYLTGLNVPLIIHIPEKFKHLSPYRSTAKTINEITSYVNLPATALNLAGISIPENFQGSPILGKNAKTEHKYIFGAKDRADDMYDLSRCIFDGRYLYIRHYLPHLSPMQEGYIMSDVFKESHIELHKVHRQGKDSVQSQKLWSPRPFEELYDIQNDPRELTNIANKPELKDIKNKLSARLRQWSIETRDSGFLTESDMHRRANENGITPYEMMQKEKLFPVDKILEAAEKASLPGVSQEERIKLYQDNDPIVRYWSVQSQIINGYKNSPAIELFKKGLQDENPTVRATAAEGLAKAGKPELAIPAFRELLKEKEPNLALYVARCLAISLMDVRPIEEEIRVSRKSYLAPPGSKKPWKDFVYSAFTTWALEWSLVKSGLNKWQDFSNK